ncbi:zinc-containing alcohol dehydrogenase [Rhypophila sp. PSN 637]
MSAQSIPKTQKQWVVKDTEHGFDGMVLEKDAPVPQVGETDVLVRMHGASLNFRDLIIPRGEYFFEQKFPVVPGSDGAGEVVAVGPKVTKWKVGDKVMTLFNQYHQSGPMNPRAMVSGLGGVIDGTLRQYGTFDQEGLVRMPSNLSYTEAASLVCAGLTSWNALFGLKPLKKGQWVLVEGTGGVSLFALQFAKAAGAHVIATTSSKEKGEILKKLGADHVINYKEDENWGETVRKLTPNGEGVDQVLELGGKNTVRESIKAIKYEGVMSAIGLLGGEMPKESIMEPLLKVFTVRGVYVGSKDLMEDMATFVEEHDIHPVMEKKEFSLDQLREAYDYMWAAKHFGKMAINID